MHLLTTLKRIATKANVIAPTLNYGGCGAFAFLVAKQLETLGVEVHVVTASPNGHHVDNDEVRYSILDNGESLEQAESWTSNGGCFHHVGVMFKWNGQWYTYDSDTLTLADGKLGEERNEIHLGTLTADEMETLVMHPDNVDYWNRRFARKSIPKLRELIQSEFASDRSLLSSWQNKGKIPSLSTTLEQAKCFSTSIFATPPLMT